MTELDAAGLRTKELAYFSKHGKPIWSEPRGLDAGYRWPQFSIHRGTLQQILLDAVLARLGPGAIKTSHHLTAWTETADGVTASFRRQGHGRAQDSYSGDLLIAADGIHSAVREKLYPDEGPPIWNGRILWRGITEADAFLSGRTMIMAGYQHVKFVCYPIATQAERRRQVSDQLDCRAHARSELPVAPRGLQSRRQARRVPAVVRGLALRLARRARADQGVRAGL